MLLPLLAVANARARLHFPAKTTTGQRGPYLPALGAPALRFQSLTPPPLLVARLAAALPSTPAGATLWGSADRIDPATAALLNGTAVHAYDFDDTHDAAIVHTMSAVLPAALAGAEIAGADGATLVAAVAGGTELACNVSLAAGHYAGWHYTTLCGGIAAALAAGITLGLAEPALADAVGNAYTLAAGNKQAVLDGSWKSTLLVTIVGTPAATARFDRSCRRLASPGR